MRCPFCNAEETRVIDSRLTSDRHQVRRRRHCRSCQERFTTYETAELNMPRVVKSNDVREPFLETKLRAGIMRALEKRPVSTEAIEQGITLIKKNILLCGEREVPSERIGEYVMDTLLRLDQVAYIRFASVYLSFEDINAFREVIDGLEKAT